MPYLLAVLNNSTRLSVVYWVQLPDYAGGKVTRDQAAAMRRTWADECYDRVGEHASFDVPNAIKDVFCAWLADAKDGDFLRVPETYSVGGKSAGLIDAATTLIYLNQSGPPAGTTVDAEQKLRFVGVPDDVETDEEDETAEEDADEGSDEEEALPPPRHKKRRPR